MDCAPAPARLAARRRARVLLSSLTTLPMRPEAYETRPAVGARQRLSRPQRVPYPRCPASWLRIAALACLLLALLAPAAAAAGPAGDRARAGRADALRPGRRRARWPSTWTRAARSTRGAPDTPRMPASVEKLYTSAAALRRLGPGGRLSTTVLAETAPDAAGVVDGDLYLRGGGDPTFGTLDARDASPSRSPTRASSGSPAACAATSRRSTAAAACRRRASASTSDVGPLSALTFNRGRSGPPLALLAAPAGALRRGGVHQAAAPARGRRAPRRATGRTPGDGRARDRAGARAPVADLLRLMNPPSDNFMAETLVKVLGARFGGVGQHGGGRARGARGARRARHRAAGRRRLRASRAATARRRATSSTLLAAMRRRRRLHRLAGGRRPDRDARDRMRGTRRAGPLPRQDRHAARRLRAGRLLHDDRAAPTSRSRSS